MTYSDAKKVSAYGHGVKAAVGLCLLLLCLSGCGEVKMLVAGEGTPSGADLNNVYDDVVLRGSDAADVLTIVENVEYDAVSQSTSVVTVNGAQKDGYKQWFLIFGFDENTLTAERKYLFIEDERPKVYFSSPRADAKLDAMVVVDANVIEGVYADENARRIAIIKNVRDHAYKDTQGVAIDNKQVAIAGMMMRQILDSAVTELAASPVLASRLSSPEGVEFSNLTYTVGRIQMTLVGGVASVKVRMGSLADNMAREGKEE